MDEHERKSQATNKKGRGGENGLSLQYDKDSLATLDGASNQRAIKDMMDFPVSWANTEYMKGRDWWLNQLKASADNLDGELEGYLKTKPFENYLLHIGRSAVTSWGKRKSKRKEVLTGYCFNACHWNM